MSNLPDDPLTAEERDAFSALSRERAPSRMLEERVVASLRDRGLLGAARRHEHRFVFGWPPLAAAAALAVSLAIFATGVTVGQWLGTQQTTAAMLQLHRQDAMQAAALVERTGSAYVSALGTLAQASGNANPQELARGKEAAQQVMQAAANEMVRLAPDDPISAQILQGLARQRARQEDDNGQAASKRRLAWY
jgi:hypothetical protein